ncbi:hypothetical protein B0J14DRAFT_272892 [Halenospora varia]|nr:hypothetical protein B0J14DRAFT_272892 [Halenospora varia]
MTRPEIIRADSIDLQDQNAPSAQDHSRKPTQPSPLGAGPPAPHQAEALREVAAEAAEQNHRSPRVSKEWTTGEVQQLQGYAEDGLVAGVTSKLNGNAGQQQDDLAIAQNGGMMGSTAEDADMADAEGDDGMDDDMMDKISSSPSIDDGGYPFLHFWPRRSTSLRRTTTFASVQACCDSSSPLAEKSDHYPLQVRNRGVGKEIVQRVQEKDNHHHLCEYPDGGLDDKFYYDRNDDTTVTETQPSNRCEPRNSFYRETPNARNDSEGHLDEDHDYQELRDEYAGVLTFPYESDEDDDEFPYPVDLKCIGSGWGAECLRDTEDIDFEFVYALHTFVATVEGQANATKGDTMVLLDDSNSYWWLVRVVKDSSIGYLPAEHIETPTERLARLNKHRNIDLTSTMLGDQAEKSKNPLKKAIRRRNAKTVAFAAPTYVEASDIDYSTEEEDGDGDFYGQNGDVDQNGEQQEPAAEEEEIAAIEPLKPRAEIREVKSDSAEPEATAASTSDAQRTSDEIFDGKLESKSRNGTVRNTDSFFKDDSVETRKITLTPNLLRDDSSTSTRTSNDSKEFQKRPSLDKLEKDSSSDKSKDKKDKKEKKEKEKKPGMLSGLFKRKEKKSKAIEDEVEEIMAGKRSNDNPRESPVPSKDSDEIVSIEEQAQGTGSDVQRQPSKLQKHPRTDMSPSRKAPTAKEPIRLEQQQAPAPERPPPADSAQAPSLRLVQSDPTADESVQQTRELSPELTRGTTPVLSAPKEQKSPSAISKILRTASGSTSEPRPVKAKKAKARVELDDFDTSEEDSPVEEPERAPSKQNHRPIPGSFPDSYMSTQNTQNERSNPAEERLSESPVQVSPITPSQSYPPPLMIDTSSQEEPPSPLSSPSPELIDADDAHDKKGAGSSTTSTSTATWSDAHLRTFFDDDADIKDLLVVVYDKSGVVPAGPDHPITGNLFREENAKLADITSRLDGMLGDWLARKMRTQGSR